MCPHTPFFPLSQGLRWLVGVCDKGLNGVVSSEQRCLSLEGDGQRPQLFLLRSLAGLNYFTKQMC